MIEDNIQALRQAARLTPNKSTEDDKVWCVVAGNMGLIDDVAYKAIASKNKVKILFREHVVLKDKRVIKKFDFIMLHGYSRNIAEFKQLSDKKGGAFLQISSLYLKEEPNLMVFVAPEDVIKHTVTTIERSKIPFVILLESQTTGFIEIDLNSRIKLPEFIKSSIKPLYSASDVVLSTILISIEKEEDIKKVQSVATSNKIFVIDFKNFKMEASQ